MEPGKKNVEGPKICQYQFGEGKVFKMLPPILDLSKEWLKQNSGLGKRIYLFY